MPLAPPKHRPPGQKTAAQRMQEFDKARGSTTVRGYDEPWKRLRVAFLKRHPNCKDCGDRATDVDHIETVRARPDRRLDWRNLRALCHSCHSRRTAIDQSGW